MKKLSATRFSKRLRFLVLFLLLCAVIGGALNSLFWSKPQAQNTTAVNKILDGEPLFGNKTTPGSKQVPQMVSGAKAAGAAFERRELFQTTAGRVADDRQLLEVLNDGTVFNLNRAAAQRMLKEDVKYLTLPLPDANGGSIELELVKVNIFAPGFSVQTSAAHNEKLDEQNLGVHYRGIVKGNDYSLVAVSIYPNEIMGFYSTETEGNVVLGRLGGKNSQDRHILYADRSLKVRPDFHCDTTDAGAPVLPESVVQEPDEILARCVKIYVEANYDLFLNKGSVANTQAYVTGLFNQSATLFSNDGIPVALSQVYVWNTPSPFTGTDSTQQLESFRTTRTTFNGDFAHLLTFQGIGGLAYVNSYCLNGYKYAVSGVNPSNVNPVPTYSQAVMIFTHETGHNLGSQHTHACAWNGNNTAIDSCGPSAPFPYTAPYEGTCSNAPLPSNGGTIMSYCHLVQNVGINFNLGFGTQPRDRILSRFNTATCLSDCGGGGCTYGISPTSSSTIAASGGGSSFSVTAGSSCSWTAASNMSWITVTSGSSGSGNGVVNFSVAANTGAARSGTITVAGQTFTVSQAAGSSSCPVTPITVGQTVNDSLTSADCTLTDRGYVDIYSFSGTAGQQVAVSMSASFDTYLFLVNPSGTVETFNDDITSGNTNSRIPVTGFYTLQSSGTYRIWASSYYPNVTGAYTVSLAGSCNYTLNPSSANVAAAGGGGSTTVAATTGCAWTATSNASWISVTSGSSGSGGAAVGYSVQANTGAARTGTMIIAGQTFTVSQAAVNTGCPPASSIAFGQTLNGTLQSGDCLYSDNSYYDAYTFNGTAGQQIYVTLNSTQFDAYLFLVQGNYPGGTSIASDNNGGGGTDARLPAASGYLTLPSSGTYTILANSLSSGMIGNYTLSLGTNTTPSTARKNFDFDGDGKADVAVFRPSNGTWYLNQSVNGFTGIGFGQNGDKLVPADYDGDGKTDVAVYRNGTWYMQRSQLGFTGMAFGDSNDIPMPADYDGDGKADVAVFRPSNGTWYLNRSQLGFTGVQFGQTGDKPVAADYDGDGKTDVAVNRSGTWYLQRSQLGFAGVSFGDANDKSVPADYDGDGKADVAVFRPSNGTWYVQRSQAGFTGIAFGLGTDLPAPADYDGDGKADLAVFRTGAWYLQRSQAGFTGVSFGASNDSPISNVFVR